MAYAKCGPIIEGLGLSIRLLILDIFMFKTQQRMIGCFPSPIYYLAVFLTCCVHFMPWVKQLMIQPYVGGFISASVFFTSPLIHMSV